MGLFEELEANRRELLASLGSGDPHRVAAALLELDDRRRTGEHVELPAPEVAVLDAFGGELPEDLLVTYLRVLRSYLAWLPSLHPDEARERAVSAYVRHGGGQSARELSLQLVTDPDPARSTSLALDRVRLEEPETERELLAAQRLVSYLLDNPSTRAAVLDVLRSWPRGGWSGEVVAAALPQLDPGEAAALQAR